ncbi:hypothetical protein V5N34_35070 [Streptomyces baarnensis]|uniref:hypothetical protein n=1 Tax=Streptomyces TaxID=1883 RepID=UPI00299FA8D0|nr:hypothetical protein [Streptomyces sp. ME02-6979.5a]MDX3342707.1 hypothetical protein [Streptomyces sp. ME02-6979.5a]
MGDYDFVRGVIWDSLSELRRTLMEIEAEQAEFNEGEETPSTVSIYSLASDVFIDGALAPLLSSEEIEKDAAIRCAGVIETLLLHGSTEVRQMVSIRITDYLLGWNLWEKFSQHSGPALLEEVGRRECYYS